MAVLGLLALAVLLLPLLSFLRSLRVGRDLDELRRRLDHLERRVSDSGVRPAPPVAAAPSVAPRPAAPPVPLAPPTPPQLAAESMRERAPDVESDLVAAIASPTRELDLEERIGGRWLQHAGLVVLLLGIAFFLRYAFEHEWLSPPIRIALGIVGGIAMAAGGVRLAARYRAYGLLLAGGGIATLFLSIYAGLNLYSLVGPQV